MIKETIITVLASGCILTGLVFFFGAALGLSRFPDFYTRMHAAGKGDTLSSFLVILGLAIYELHDVTFSMAGLKTDWFTILLVIKLLAICGFIAITSPTGTHALMDAGWEEGIKPDLKNEDANDLAKDLARK